MGPPSADQVAVLSMLYQTEISANIGELQAATSIVLGQLAYLAATLFFIATLDVRLLPLLPLAVVFASAYQMLRAAVVVRRAALARTYERCLAEVAGFGKQYDEGKLGSPYYGALDDLGVISKAGGVWWKGALAATAYFGLYILVVCYTVLVLVVMWRRGEDGAVGLSVPVKFACSFGYLALFAWIGFSARYLFRTDPPASLCEPPAPPDG